METLQTVSYLFDNCHRLREDVLSIVVVSGEMFNKDVCLFSKTNEGLKIEPSHNTQHTRSPPGLHPQIRSSIRMSQAQHSQVL